MAVQLRELLPGYQVLDCARLSAALSPDACCDNYGRRRLAACADCPIGAELTGEPIRPAISKKLCCRCGRTDLRLIRHQICVGCFNREREFLIGRNAKGQVPVRARRIFATNVFVSGVGRVHLDRVADVAEAVLAVLRRHPDAAARPLPPPCPAVTAANP